MFSGQLTTPDRFSYHTGSDFQYCHVSPTQGLNSFKSFEDCSKWKIIWITIQCEYFGYNQFHHLTTAGQPQELLTYCILSSSKTNTLLKHRICRSTDVVSKPNRHT